MAEYTEDCVECPLYRKGDINDGSGPKDARFLVVTDQPSAKKESYGRLLGKNAMTYFGKAMQAEHFTKDDFYFYPRVRCPFDPDTYTTKEKTKMQKCCRPHFVDKFDEIRPEVVIPLGADASAQVFGRATKIMKVRGIPDRTDELEGAVILPLLNPIMPVIYPQHESVFASDCATLGRLVDNDYDIEVASRSVIGEYEFIDDLEFLVQQRPKVIAFDTENTGLRWFAPDAKILTMQFCIEPGKAYMLPWDHPDRPQSKRAKKRLVRQLAELLCAEDVTVIGQNAKYDAGYLAAETGVTFRIGGDTLMMAALLDENSYTKNLDDLVKRFVPEMAGYADRFNATVDKSRMIELPLDQDFLEYGCGDADSTFRLHQALLPLIEEDEKLYRHYQYVSLPGLNALRAVESRGLYVDPDEADRFEAYMIERLEGEYQSLLKRIPRSIRRLHLQLAQDKAGKRPVDPRDALSFGKKGFLLDTLFWHDDGLKLKPRVFTKGTAKLEDDSRKIPSLSTKDHLPYFYETHPFVFELAEYIKAERILTANVQGFRKKYIVDGMVRPTYGLHVTVTGRTNSEDPNGQNFPKRGPVAKAYRKIYIPPPGYVILEADLSQAELRIAGDMANDPTMIRIYREDGDIHTMTALIVMNITEDQFRLLPKEEQKLARTKAKAVNFGFLYGMGWRKFIAYAKTQYGVTFTEKEAQRIRAEFFETYFKLPEWHEKMRAFARENGFVRSYSGRIRHLPMIDSSDEMIRGEAERQAINSPVQEFGSSLGVMACGRMHEEIDPTYLPLVGFVHDALYAYVPLEYVEWGAKTLKWYMQTNPIEEWFGRKMKVPIVADVGFGMSLGSVFEMGKLNVPASGRVTVGDYDFDALWAREELDIPPVRLPRQRIPPNNGRRVESPYGLLLAA